VARTLERRARGARFFLAGGGGGEASRFGEGRPAALRLAGREVVAAAAGATSGAGAGPGVGATGPAVVAPSLAASAGPARVSSLPEPGLPGRPSFFRTWPKRVWDYQVSGVIIFHVNGERESRTNPGNLFVFEAAGLSNPDPVDVVLHPVEADKRPQHVDVCRGRLGRGRRCRVGYLIVGRHFLLVLESDDQRSLLASAHVGDEVETPVNGGVISFTTEN